MKKREDHSELSPDDMRAWLVDEVHNVLKECELRLRDATEFTTGYATGSLSSKEAHERFKRYSHRWRDPLSGLFALFKTDEGLIHAIDEKLQADVERRVREERLSGKRGSTGRSR